MEPIRRVASHQRTGKSLPDRHDNALAVSDGK